MASTSEVLYKSHFGVVVVGLGVGSWAGFGGLEKEIDTAPCLVWITLLVAASPTSELERRELKLQSLFCRKELIGNYS